jgi:hypothetical protein
MGVIEGQPLLSANGWEEVRKGGAPAIRRWIAEQMSGKSCVVVLVGARTAGRPWVDYEIKKAWADRKGLLAVHIHKLQDRDKRQDSKGTNPFSKFTVGSGRTRLSSIVKTYDPPGVSSKGADGYIDENLETWVEEAIAIRKASRG